MSYYTGYNKVMRAAGLEKEARAQAGAGLVSRAGEFASDAVNYIPGVRQAREGFSDYRRFSKARDRMEGRPIAKGLDNSAQRARRELAVGSAKALGTVGGVGAVGAGISHARSPADTYSNHMKQVSNQHLGTNFKQQSRFNHWRNR